jgi:ankyrin repeat protein
MVAAQGGHAEIVKALLANGAEVNAKTTDGSTALIIAVAHGHTEIVDFLKQHGAKE